MSIRVLPWVLPVALLLACAQAPERSRLAPGAAVPIGGSSGAAATPGGAMSLPDPIEPPAGGQIGSPLSVDAVAPGMDMGPFRPDGARDQGGSEAMDARSGDAAPAATPASCGAGDLLLCQDFEATAAGAVPAGWSRVGQGVEVVSDEVRGGVRALRVMNATSGPRRITRTMSLPGTHWGRVYYKVKAPPPLPSGGGVIHSTFVAFSGTSPVGGTAEWRVVDTVENSQGRHQFLYNVQPNGRGEFGKGSSYDWSFDGKWHCAEWFIDAATQSYRFHIDGTEVTQIAVNNGAGNYSRSEMPMTFASVAVGWNTYQNANPGFVAWFDDFALSRTRIGCTN